MFHFGCSFDLFPNYFNSFVNPKKMLLPVCKLETRSDFFNPISLAFRLCSASFILYLLIQFCQDEKNMEDLKEIKDQFYDIYEFSTDYVLGEQLGDGSKNDQQKNTKQNQEATFTEKIKS